MTASDILFRPDKFYSWLKVACLTAMSNQVQHLPSPIWRSVHHKVLLDNCQICKFQSNLSQWTKPLYFSFQVTQIFTLFSRFTITSLAAMERDSSLIKSLIPSMLDNYSVGPIFETLHYPVEMLNIEAIPYMYWISKGTGHYLGGTLLLFWL